MSKAFNVLIRLCLLFLIVWTPLAFACTETWALAIMEWAALVMGMLWILKMLVAGRVRYVKNPLNAPILLFLLWTAFQLIPLPPLLKVLSPVTHELYVQYAPGYERPGVRGQVSGVSNGENGQTGGQGPETERPGARGQGSGVRDGANAQHPTSNIEHSTRTADQGPETGERGPSGSGERRTATTPRHREPNTREASDPSPAPSSAVPIPHSALRTPHSTRPLSVYPYATRMKLFELLCYALVFFVVVNTVRKREHLLWIVVALIAVGSFEALYGLLQYLSGHQHIWSYKKEVGRDCVTGTYINRNHLAGYLEMVIPLAIGLVVSMRKGDREARYGGLRARLARLGSDSSARQVMVVAAATLMGVALLFSRSRAGIAGFFLAAAVLWATLRVFRSGKRSRWISAAAVALMLFAGSWLGLSIAFERFGAFFEKGELTLDRVERLSFYRGCMELSGRGPLTGFGLGCFVRVFPLEKEAFGGQWWLTTHAHNDYLETLVEAGYPALLIVLAALAGLAAYVLPRCRRHSRSKSVPLAAGAIGGIGAMLFHSIFDFNLHIPANALTFAILLGIAVSASRLAARRPRRSTAESSPLTTRHPSPATSRRSPATGHWSLAIRATVLLVIVVLLGLFVREIAPSYRAGLHYETGRRMLLEKPANEEDEQLERVHTAKGLLSKALETEPANTDHAYELSHVFLAEMKATADDDARQIRVLAARQSHMLAEALPHDPLYAKLRRHLAYALRLAGRTHEGREQIMKSVDLCPENPYAHRDAGLWFVRVDLRQALTYYRRALSLAPRMFAGVASNIKDRFGNSLALCGALPADAALWHRLAGILDREKFQEEAIAACERALSIDPTYQPAYGLLATLCIRHKCPRRAAQVLWGYVEEGVENPGIFFHLSRALWELKLWDEVVRVREMARSLSRRNPETKPRELANYQYQIGLAYYRKRDYAAAVEEFRNAIDITPKFAAAHCYSGLAYRNQREYKLAVEPLRKALFLSPKNQWYRRLLAITLRDTDRSGEAIRVLKEGLRFAPESQVLRWELAYTYETTGHLAEAEQEYAAVLRQNPEHKAAKAGLERVGMKIARELERKQQD